VLAAHDPRSTIHDPRSTIHDPRSTIHAWRAWCFLVWLSVRRQARARLMVWVSLGMLALLTFLVALATQAGGWSVAHRHWPGRGAPTNAEWLEGMAQARTAVPWDPASLAVQDAVGAACGAAVQDSGFYVFSQGVVLSIFATFLLPIWSLSFATEGLGREREAGSLLWLLTRPLPRPAIYLATFAAGLPWSLGLCLGGFGLLCLAAGAPGRLAFALYWPAALLGALAFSALFHLLGAMLRRAAVVAILYAFFLETVMGNLPGYLKRLSISFYTRCVMFDRAGDFGIRPERPESFLPVGGTTALVVLAGATVVLLAAGVALFARREYLDLA
jgi:hypothetical protein